MKFENSVKSEIIILIHSYRLERGKSDKERVTGDTIGNGVRHSQK